MEFVDSILGSQYLTYKCHLCCRENFEIAEMLVCNPGLQSRQIGCLTFGNNFRAQQVSVTSSIWVRHC